MMAVRVNPTKIVQHAPVDMFEIWRAEILLSCLRKRGARLFVGDRLQVDCPNVLMRTVYRPLWLLPLACTGQGSVQF